MTRADGSSALVDPLAPSADAGGAGGGGAGTSEAKRKPAAAPVADGAESKSDTAGSAAVIPRFDLLRTFDLYYVHDNR